MVGQKLYLGIDGGGSGCRVRLANSIGEVIGEGQAGPANTLLGLPNIFKEITAAAHEALNEAGLGRDMISTLNAGAGLAGLSLAREREKFKKFSHPFSTLLAESDAYTACLGAHGGEDGGIVIAGTGSCGLAMANGQIHTVGGWGFALSDQGGAAALGRAALRIALLEHDGIRPTSSLGIRIMRHFQYSPEKMYLWTESATTGMYAKFALWVFECAAHGEASANLLLKHTASEIAELIKVVSIKNRVKVALIGGLSKPIEPWLPKSVLPHLTSAKNDPLYGALVLAKSKINQ